MIKNKENKTLAEIRDYVLDELCELSFEGGIDLDDISAYVEEIYAEEFYDFLFEKGNDTRVINTQLRLKDYKSNDSFYKDIMLMYLEQVKSVLDTNSEFDSLAIRTKSYSGKSFIKLL